MPWKLTPFGETRIALPGVPWRDLSDAEMREAEERHPEIKMHGYFEHVTRAELDAEAEAEAAEQEAAQDEALTEEGPTDA